MKFLPALALLLLYDSPAFAASDPIVPGDRIFIQARVIGCDDTIQNVEYGEVESSGDVVLFGNITLHVQGKTAEQVRELVSSRIEARTGRKPTSIKVIRVAKEDSRLAAFLLLQIYDFRKRGCPRPWIEPQVPDWLDVEAIAKLSHNKSFNYAAAGCRDACRAGAP